MPKTKTCDELRKRYIEVMHPHDLDFDKNDQRFVVRLWDGMDGCWTDCTKATTAFAVLKEWDKRTNGGTTQVNFNEIDYFRIFPAETTMTWNGSEGRDVSMSATNRVREALRNTPADHLQRCLRQRCAKSGEAQGSTYRLTTELLLTALQEELEWEPYNHVNIKTPAVGFIATHFGGSFGMMRLSELPDDAVIVLVSNPKVEILEGVLSFAFGKQGSMIDKPSVDFSVCLLGPGGDGKEIVWTFHPGDPVPPSSISDMSLAGHIVSKNAAQMLGIEWIKLPDNRKHDCR